MSFSRYLHPEEEHNGSAGVVGVLPRDERGHDEAKKSREDCHHRQGRYRAEENLKKKTESWTEFELSPHRKFVVAHGENRSDEESLVSNFRNKDH